MRTAGRVDSRVDRAHRVIAAKGWVFEGAVLDGSEGWTAQIDRRSAYPVGRNRSSATARLPVDR